MKKIFLFLMLSIVISVPVFAAMSMDNFRNLKLGNNHGKIDDPKGHVTMNLKKGWNMLPLRFIGEASGRYNSNYKEGITCDQKIFKNVWMYSPLQKEYYHLPTIEDWRYPVTRNNNYLFGEFKSKSHHIYAGSGWIYSDKDCTLEGDDGAGLIAMNYGREEGVGYNYKELTLKAGWNFVPADYYWSAAERSFADVFSGCEMQKFNMWDNQNQKWIFTAEQMKNPDFAWNEPISPAMTFTTLVIKTGKDCKLAQNVLDGPTTSAPPAIPN